MSGEEVSFPIDERLLPRATISKNRFNEWKTIAHNEIKRILETPSSWYFQSNELKKSFRSVFEKDAMYGYARKQEDTKQDVLCIAHLDMTLDDVAFGLYATTTQEQRQVLIQFHEGVFLDGAILQVHETRTATDPFQFTGLKWAAYTSPAHDHIYFESTGTMVDTNHQTVLFQYQRSFPIQPQELGSFKYGLQRTSLYNITLYRMENEQVLLQSMGCVEAGRNVPTWMMTRSITDALMGAKNMVHIANARALVDAGMMKVSSTSRTGSSKVCMGGCHKKFTLLRHRIRCRGCVQDVCKSCIVSFKFFNEQSQYTTCLPSMTERFCPTCIQHARARRAVDRLAATFVSSTSRSGSTTTEKSKGQRYSRAKVSSSLLENPTNTPMSTSASTLNSSTSSGVGSTRSCSPTIEEMPVGFSSEERHWTPEMSGMSYNSRSSTQQSPPKSGNTRETMFEQMNASIRQQEELLMTMQKERARIHQQQQYALHHSTSAPFSGRQLTLSDMTVEFKKSPSMSDEERFEILS